MFYTHLHGTVVGDVDVARHLCVVQDAAKVQGCFLKLKVGEVHLPSQSNVVLKMDISVQQLFKF